MADPLILNPTLTLAGQAAAFNANNTGIELILDAVSFGRAHYNPTGNELALVDPVGSRVPFAGGSRPTVYQLRISAAWNEDVGEVGIGEIGFWSGDTLVFVWSLANGTVASYKTDGVAYVLMADIGFAQVPAGSINIVIDSNIDAALAALSEHEGAANAHPQYLLRSDVAKDAGPLMGLVHAAGSSANALVLSLDAPESKLPALAKFQRFQFVATDTNTGPVTVNIAGLGVKAVKRGGDTGLIELDAGDIKAGSLYDLNYDGASFQLGGGVGSGKAFERFAFKASVAQKVFAAPHVPGSIIVFLNGREIFDYTSAADGSKITLTNPCNMDDDVVIVALKSFKVADGYTKAEVDALMKTASGMPVGAMLPVPKGVVPPGYLEADGSLFVDALYPDLATYLNKKYNIAGDPADSTRLPETRGEFLRGWDHNRGVDAGRAVGSYQLDALQNITGQYSSTNGTAVGQTFGGAFEGVGSFNFPQPSSSTYNNNPQLVKFDASRVARTSTETRGRNLAVMWCIKAWNAPVNQGQIDVAALAPLALQATEVKQGTAKVSTQIQTDAGTDDETIVTPKKLRWGFQILKAANGYVVFPSWLGGLVIQWGQGLAMANDGNDGNSAGADTYILFPLMFPIACASVVASHFGHKASLSVIVRNISNIRFTAETPDPNSVQLVKYIAIGY